MRFRTLEIRWHDSKPISTCDFQPVGFKKARPPVGQETNFAAQSYRLDTGGEDNHVRIWMVHPNIMPLENATVDQPAPRQPRVEYLATLSRHSAAVNVVRFSPNGDVIASAGDDGMIIIWAPSNSPQSTTYGSDLSPEDMQYEKEHWKPRTTFRCTTMQVYDLAWSPTGEYLIAGSTDNCARVFAASDGKCVHEIAEHSHFVQGVAWDPLNEYIATQSSDRSMHIYSISNKQGNFEAHAVGKNTRMPHRHSRTPSTSGRPKMRRHESNTSDAESSVSEITNKDDFYTPSASGSQHHISNAGAPLTPATSIASTPSTMFPPPPIDKPSSRRSSFSGSNAPSSPAHYGRFGRSPSPMPALPAIRGLPSASGSWASVKLYGDESFTNFFRRLNFSPDGGLLLTPAGQFEDPSVNPGSSKSLTVNKIDEQPARGRKTRPSVNTGDTASHGSASSVYIYSRANFARPPIAQLPGHKKASVAVRFSPILYELRDSVGGTEHANEPKTAILERGNGGTLDLDVIGTRSSQPATTHDNARLLTHHKRPSLTQSTASAIASPSPVVAGTLNTMMPSPALTPIDMAGEPISKPPTPAPSSLMNTGSIFALPYRMLFAVVTMDTVAIYDTQQAGPVCLLTKLHYDEFTDMSWSPDGQCLILSSRDGYCTIVVFDEIIPAHHTQQQALQLQSIAHHHSVPLTHTTSTSSMSAAPSSPQKRSRAPSLTPVTSTEELPAPVSIGEKRDAVDEVEATTAKSDEPPKKKRRVALTRVGDLDP
ncbi:WD40 repeat-like protein [Athelia psychrophila]|uniref:WD40 repeat-like protein n=1 Tax=Athelia psychrophila TaxID=1759441 RepID=A0A166FZH5_9AGAM|nr:WD40 repeat-like protein [Fibularhizoctonia sp. CBS 109695]